MKSYGTRFAISSGCQYATKAAADTLAEGGNIFDAALAGSAVLCVTSPHAVSIGGDLFALIKETGSGDVIAVNATGAAPRGVDISFYRSKGFDRIPTRGPLSIQIPGFIAGWELMARRWATLPPDRLLEPATLLARDGFKAGARFARLSSELAKTYAPYRGWTDTYLCSGAPIPVGGIFKQSRLADALSLIAREGAKAFYAGTIAEDIARTVAAAGGVIDRDDFLTVTPQVTRSLATRIGRFSVNTQPPVSQGAVLLRAFRLFEEAIRNDDRDIEELWPKAAAATRTAFAERSRLLGDQKNSFEIAEAMVEGRLSTQNLDADLTNTGTDTTNISVIDSNGRAASFILSIFADFGSGIVSDNTGILLNNRLTGFTLEEGNPNALKPGKRAMHTLHSVIVLDGEGDVVLAGGSPGGHAQPQANLQVLSRTLLRNEDLENAVTAPRWMLTNTGGPYGATDPTMRNILCEPGIGPELQARFKAAGFQVVEMARQEIGSAKWVQRCGQGELVAACDGRRDAMTAAL